MNVTLSRSTVLAVLASWSVAVLAHDTWLAPDRYHRVSQGAVTLSLTSGMEFPKLDHAIKPDRVAVAEARDASRRTVDITTTTEAEHALTLTRNVADGVSTFWVILHPRPSQLEAAQVREYVEHLGLADPEAVIAAWEKKRAASVSYRYVKYAKTFVRAGHAERGRAWSEASGMRLELVPETDPTRLAAGDDLRLRLIDEGKALPRYPVSVIHDGGTRTYQTDEQGRVTIEIPAAGPYLVRAATLVGSAVPETEWDVHFTTLTFEAHGHQ